MLITMFKYKRTNEDQERERNYLLYSRCRVLGGSASDLVDASFIHSFIHLFSLLIVEFFFVNETADIGGLRHSSKWQQ